MNLTMVVMEEISTLLMFTFTKTTSLMKLAQTTELVVMTMVFLVLMN